MTKRFIPMPRDPRSRRPTIEPLEEPCLSEHAQRQIGRKLRLLYEELEAEAIPDKILGLLRALAEKESKSR